MCQVVPLNTALPIKYTIRKVFATKLSGEHENQEYMLIKELPFSNVPYHMLYPSPYYGKPKNATVN